MEVITRTTAYGCAVTVKHRKTYIKSYLASVRGMKQVTQSWCSGTTQRDGVGREVVVGAIFQDGGTHVHLWLIHVDIWQKPSQYCKVIILQLK